MAKSKSKLELEDALANTLAESINNQFKGQAFSTCIIKHFLLPLNTNNCTYVYMFQRKEINLE